MSSSLLLKADVMRFMVECQANGCNVAYDKDAGTMVCKDDGITVFQAIEKGNGQPWIATFTDSPRIKWGSSNMTTTAKFDLGKVVATPGALAALEKTKESIAGFLARHHRCDWGVMDADDQKANFEALVDEGRIFSTYLLKDGTKIWIITEAVGDDGKRESTCVLLPEEY
jgi:hypothetical protein